MYSSDHPTQTQITVHYRDGQTESFMLYPPMSETEVSEQQFQLNVRHLLDSPWWVVHLPDQTVFINMANVLKIEASPPLSDLHGRDVLPIAERITALNRASR